MGRAFGAGRRMIGQEVKSNHMSIPTSLPVAPAQPAEASYPPDALKLFKKYTREKYLAEFGEQAPPWNPERPAKAWFDSSAQKFAGGKVTYNVIARDADGKFTMQPLLLDATEAATVNLPGVFVYPKYDVPLSETTRAGHKVYRFYLSLESEARALMALLGGTGLFDEGDTREYPAIYPADEPRRMWAFFVYGKPISTGILLQSKNSNGVGRGGHWVRSGDDPVWLPDPPAPTGLNDPRPPMPDPVRDLLTDELVVTDPMGFGVLVRRSTAGGTTGQGTPAFTAEDRWTLQQIYEIVSRLQTK